MSQKVTRTQRELKNLNIEELCHNMDFTSVNNSVTSVDECVKLMEGEIKRSLDIAAPVKTFTMVIRQRKDWFDEEVSDQKRKVRREERKWIKYREQQQWRIYHHERNKYN